MPMGSKSSTIEDKKKSLHKRNSSMKSKTIYDNPSVIKPPSLEGKQSISVPRQRNTTRDLESIQEDHQNKQKVA